MILAALVLLAQVEVVSTRCQVVEANMGGETIEWRLVGCGDGFPDNLAWHVDRADSLGGELDGRYARGTTGRGAVVYVVDTGIMPAHDEFVRADGNAVLPSVNVGHVSCPENERGEPCPVTTGPPLWVESHGTAVASVVAGKNVGIAPGAKLVSVRLTPETVGDFLLAFDAIIRHAWQPSTPQFSTAIITMSTGVYAAPKPGAPTFADMERKIREMVGGVDAEGRPDPNGKKFLFTTAAYNSDPDPRYSQCDAQGNVRAYPSILGAGIDGLVTVGGITRENRWWSGSCGGPAVEVAAPAADMLVASTSARDHYRGPRPNLRSGTSWSAPYVAGIAARLLETHPNATPAELERMLKSSISWLPDRNLPVPVIPPPVESKRRAARH